MSIVAIVSSPRKNANTDFLVNAVAEGAKENGKDVQTFYLNTLKDKKGCQGCDACKKNGGTCVTKTISHPSSTPSGMRRVSSSPPPYISERPAVSTGCWRTGCTDS